VTNSIQDAPIIEMTHEDWKTVIDPKVNGALNLHHASLHMSLDFFLLASSLVTIVEQPGQGNYNAANTFLEAFCQYRRKQDLPASVLNICPISDVGFVAENPQARKNLRAQGLYFLNEQSFLDFIELAVIDSTRSIKIESKDSQASWWSSGQFIMGLRSEQPLDDPNNRTNWRRDRRMAIYHNLRSSGEPKESNKNSALLAFLERITDDPDSLLEHTSQQHLGKEIGHKIFAFMLRPDEEVILDHTLTQIGLDSLMAIELRRWWKQMFKLEISVLEIMAAGTLEQLGKMAAEGMRKRLVEGGEK
jgi:aryl carrier-like protein